MPTSGYNFGSFANMPDTPPRHNTRRQMSRSCDATNGVSDDNAGKGSLHRQDSYDGGREGFARSDDAQLEVRLSPPGSGKAGTNPEQLFAAGWLACFIGALGLAAAKHKLSLPPKRQSMLKSISPDRLAAFSFEPGLPSACPASTRTLRDLSSPKRIRPAPIQRQRGGTSRSI